MAPFNVQGAAPYYISLGDPMNFLCPNFKIGGRAPNIYQLKYQLHFRIVRVWGVWQWYEMMQLSEKNKVYSMHVLSGGSIQAT